MWYLFKEVSLVCELILKMRTETTNDLLRAVINILVASYLVSWKYATETTDKFNFDEIEKYNEQALK